MALEKFRAPPLPNPGPEFDAQYIRQLIRVLELYFSQLDSATPNYASSYRADNFYGGEFHGDGRDIFVPYGQFESSADQTAAAVDVAYPITYNSTTFSRDVSYASSSRIVFAHPGIYVIAYSLQLQTTSNDQEFVDVWLRYKGTNIASTNTRFPVPARKSASVPSHMVAVTPIMVEVAAANDYVELMWHTTNTLVTIENLPAVTASPGVTPAIPATPSVIVAVTYVSPLT